MIEKTFDTGSLKLNYMEGSPGGLPLLLLHGLNTRWQAFYYLIPEMEKQIHVYALDLRGHGKSDRAPSYQIQDYLPDIQSFIKDCIKEPTIVFGHSFGGMIGTMLAAYYPELVKALVIGDSIMSKEYAKEFAINHRDTTIWWRDLARINLVEDIISELKQELMPLPGQKELVPAYKVLGENNPHFQFFAQCLTQNDTNMLTANIDFIDETYDNYNPEQLLPKVQCPTLVFQAEPKLGGLMRDEDAKTTLGLLKKGSHIKLNNVGHFFYLQDKGTVIRKLFEFMKTI